MRLLSALLAVALSTAVDAQSFPLPGNMTASFGMTWAETFWLPVAVATDQVSAKVTFENSGKSSRVCIEWFGVWPGLGADMSRQSVETSFRPTAVARRAGTTRVLYVVGWSELTGQVVVESWTFGDFVLPNAENGGERPAPAPPSIARAVVWSSDPTSLPPVWDAACQTFGNTLLLLTSGTPTKIFALDLGSQSLRELYSAALEPALAGAHMLCIARHGSDGFVAVAEPRKVWGESCTWTPGEEPYFVMRDTNLDGVFDSTSAIIAREFYVKYPPPWDNKYVEP